MVAVATLLVLLGAPPAAEVQAFAAAAPLECSSLAEQADWPIYHVMNNVTREPRSGRLKLEWLNDANAISYYRGIYHVMMQEGGGNWSHAVSNDLVRWHHIKDALDRTGGGIGNTSFADGGPCDGTMSFPDLGVPPYNGSTPLIIYDAACGVPLPSNMTPPSGPFSRHKVPGDVARLEVARPADPSDPYLASWTKTAPGPVVFDGVPCAFPSRIWRSASGAYWNMLCAVDGEQPWARFVSHHPDLMSWKLADAQFSRPIAVGCYDCTQTGIMFQPLPSPPPGGPTHIINGNWSGNGAYDRNCRSNCPRHDVFYLGTYDPHAEVFDIDMQIGPQVVESGVSGQHCLPGQNCVSGTASWAVAGRGGDGRLLSIAWINDWTAGFNVASLVRELHFDAASRQLVQRPAREYELLRNLTLTDAETMTLRAGDGPRTLDVPPSKAASMDLTVSFHVSTHQGAVGPFGVAVRAPRPGSRIDALGRGSGMVLQFNVSAPERVTGARVVTSFGVKATLPTFKVLKGETLDVRVLLDRALAETFLQGGRVAFVDASMRFSLDNSSVYLFNHGAALVSANVSAHQMACGWTSELPTPKLQW